MWVRYSFVAAACLLAVATYSCLDRATEGAVGPFWPAFAAVIACAAWAGPGPGVASTLLLLVWGSVSLLNSGSPWAIVLLLGFIFAAEGLLLSAGSARILRSAKAAARSETWHRQLVETAAEGIWVRDGDNVITYANARMAAMLGLPPESLAGRNANEFFFAEDQLAERIRLQSLTSGIKEQFDRRMRRSDGEELWVLACCNLMPAEGRGEQRLALVMMTDITERKRAEQALRHSEERFRNLFERVLEGVYQSTPDGRILAANPKLLEMLGFKGQTDTSDIRIARDLFVDPLIRQRLLEQLEREGSFQNVEYQMRTRDGRVITVLSSARAVRDPDGHVIYIEGTLTDISDRKRIEDQLRRAQKIEALGRLAAGVAHDFDLVLEVITRHTQQVLKELPAGHAARNSAEQAMQAAERAVALTRQLLSFSQKPGTGDDRPLEHTDRGQGETILLVDDEPLVRELSRDMLERQGYRVMVASDAGEAERLGNEHISAAGGRVFDLLIADTSMPSMSGMELARRLRATHPGLKVLFICGYADPPVEHDEPASPGTAFLQKPFSADSLGRKIRQMLGRDAHSRSDET